MADFDNPFDPMLAFQCEWVFNGDPKRDREGWYTPESIGHPAKMDVHLAQAITTIYTEPGQWLYDPMSGIGTNVIEPMKLGRNVLAVELEGKFVKMQTANMNLTQKKLNKGVPFEVALWSGNAKSARNIMSTRKPSAWMDNANNSTPKLVRSFTEGMIDAVITSPPFGEQNHKMGKSDQSILDKYPDDCHYSDDKQNIGNMKYGKIDAIITSPPFPSTNTGGGAYKAAKGTKGENDDYAGLNIGTVAQILSDDPMNLDNIKRYGDLQLAPNGKTSFLGELFEIMAESASILKVGGLFIMHSKDSVKGGKRVTMGADIIAMGHKMGLTFLPCHECGAGSDHTHRRRIPRPSFWINQRVNRWLVETVPGYTAVKDKNGDATIFLNGKRQSPEQIRTAAVNLGCIYAGYFESVIVMKKMW